MISRLLTFLLLIPLAVLLVVFCVVNRHAVEVSMDPFGTLPNLSFQAPLFLLILVSLIVGVIVGGIATFATQARYRAKASRRRREVETLRHEVDESHEKLRRLREERERERADAARYGRPGPSGATANTAHEGLAAPQTPTAPALAGPRPA